MNSDAIDALHYALSTLNETDRLLSFLTKLNIKSAQNKYRTLGKGAPLKIEPLDAILKSVQFDMMQIKLWSTLKHGNMYHAPATHKLCMLLHKFGIQDAKNYLPVGIDPNIHIDDIA